MKLTIKTLRGFGPCYDPTKYFSEDWQGTLQDILKDDRIPSRDRIWVFGKAMPKSTCREFARWCALQVIDLWDAPDVVREYLETGNEEIRCAARAAARASMRAAAGAAARDAARAAARSAAGDAAGAAARYAAGDQVAAARYAAGDAWEAQLQKALELVNQ
jgi:hypothetical protein